MLLRAKKKKKETGILMAISSLPGKYAIGSLGKPAYDFVDFLKNSKQQYWQMLPLVPLGEGNSPYKSCSCFAGEILYIDIDILVRDGLLYPDETECELTAYNTDYEAARRLKLPLLCKAAERFDCRRRDFQRFLRDSDDWLNDYALFMAALDERKTNRICDMHKSIKLRSDLELKKLVARQKKAMRFYKITQFLFYSQFFELRRYAHNCGIKLIGDIPFYVALDSADVWKEPEAFRLGKDLTPVLVAGVPPDSFSEDGQLWGNPIYDWEHLKRNDYLWWQRRLRHTATMYDIIRIDHFRAFASYFTIPYGSENAKCGCWEKGVGTAFWDIMTKRIGKLNIIAEDLGGEDEPEVQCLIRDTEFPNMKVLQFAFSTDVENVHLPKNYAHPCVCYTGTHDNDTVMGWYSSATQKERIYAEKTAPPLPGASMALRMISLAISSKAARVIIPMQDWLELGSEARMNTPGTLRGNWEWRLDPAMLTDRLCQKIISYSKK